MKKWWAVLLGFIVVAIGGYMNQIGSSEASSVAGSNPMEGQSVVLGLWGVRYQVKDVSRSIDFYTKQLGIKLDQKNLPAFAQGLEPKKYLCVYPFVRTPDWYLLPSEERGKLLRDHGLAGREFPDVLANTTAAFGLGDYEWILAFEADSLYRIVDLIRRLRATEARRYTGLEVPFLSGIRKPLAQAIANLP